MKMPWPKATGPEDKASSAMLKYLKDLKSEVRQGWQTAQKGGGGKKKKAKQAEPAEAPKLETCNIFCAMEYPEMEKRCLEVLRGFQFDENSKLVGDHVAAIREAFPDKKQSGLAMKFVSFRLRIAETDGPEVALQLESSFDEIAVVSANKPFLFEGMAGIKNVNVFLNTSDAAKAVPDSEKARSDAVPSRPSIQFAKDDAPIKPEQIKLEMKEEGKKE